MNLTVETQKQTLEQIKQLHARIQVGRTNNLITNLRLKALLVLNQFDSGKIPSWDVYNRLCSICKTIVDEQKEMGLEYPDSAVGEILNKFFSKREDALPSHFFGASIVKYRGEGGQKKAVVYDFGDPFVESTRTIAKPLQLEDSKEYPMF
jgi:hypothetical protein